MLYKHIFIAIREAVDNQGRIQGGGHKKKVPPKAPSNFVTNIILYRRLLFYKFTDITVMFLSRDSLY